MVVTNREPAKLSQIKLTVAKIYQNVVSVSVFCKYLPCFHVSAVIVVVVDVNVIIVDLIAFGGG